MAGQAGVWRYRSQCSVLPHRTTTQQVVQVKVEVQVERQVKVDGRMFEDTAGSTALQTRPFHWLLR